MTIKMSKTQLTYNMKMEERIFTSVSVIDSFPNRNCFTCIRSWGFIRIGEHGCTKTNWKWVVSRNGSGVCRIETDGEGLYLGPTSGKWFETVRNGLYLMKQGGLYDGRELILDPISPFKISSFLVLFGNIIFRKRNIIYNKNGNWWDWW